MGTTEQSRTRMVASLLFGVCLLAGCGGNGGSGASGSDAKTATELGNKVCGSDFQQDTEVEMYVRGQGTCGDVWLYTFETNEARDQWQKVGAQMGASGVTRLGDRLAVVAPTQAQTDEAMAKLS